MAILLSLIVKLIQIEFVCHSHSRFSFYELNNPLTTMLHIICTKSKEDHISPAEEKQIGWSAFLLRTQNSWLICHCFQLYNLVSVNQMHHMEVVTSV